MTYREILDDILFYTGQSGGGTFEAAAKRFVNQVYSQILEVGGFSKEVRTVAFTTVAGQAAYGMPLYVDRVLSIVDDDQDRYIYEVTPREMEKKYPSGSDTGTPDFAYPAGTFGVQKQPAADGLLSLESDSASDVTTRTVRVVGYTPAEVLVTESVTLTGATHVHTTNSFDATLGLDRVIKDTDVTYYGNITVKDVSGNVLAVVPQWCDSPEYQWFKFYPIPAAAGNYTIRVETQKMPLVNNSDWPEIPDKFHHLLVFGVTKDLLPNLGKVEVGQVHAADFRQLLKEMVAAQNKGSATTRMFADVQSGARMLQRPHRPLIRGIDFGQVA